MVFLANLIVRRARRLPVHVIYPGLVLALALNYFVGPQNFLYSSPWIKAIIAGGVSALPILFAGLAFSQLFKRATDTQHALGSNLLGALLGGFMEYMGLLLGFDALILVILALYLGSYACTWRQVAEGSG